MRGAERAADCAARPARPTAAGPGGGRPSPRRNLARRAQPDVAEVVPYVRAVVRRRLASVPALAMSSSEDLLQEALLAVVRAAPAFDDSRGVPFAAWATRRAVGAAIDYLRRTRFGPSRGPAWPQPASLDEPVPDGGGTTLLEVIPAARDPIADADLELSLEAELSRLEAERPRHATILRLRYLHDVPQLDVAVLLGISQSRVSQIEIEALDHLRASAPSLA